LANLFIVMFLHSSFVLLIRRIHQFGAYSAVFFQLVPVSSIQAAVIAIPMGTAALMRRRKYSLNDTFWPT